MDLWRGINVDAAVAQVGTSSAIGEREIWDLIARAMEKAGNDGVITESLMSEDLGLKLEKIELNPLGVAKKIREGIRTADYDTETLQEGLAKHSRGDAVLTIGSASEVDISKRDPVTDTLNATKSCCEGMHCTWHQRQRVLLLKKDLQNRSFCLKHFQFSFHGDARALKQQRPWPKEKSMDAFNWNPTSEPKRTVDVQSLNRQFNDAHRPTENYPSKITQLRTAVEPESPSATVDQRRTRDLNAPGNLDQSTSSSAVEAVQPGSKGSCKPVATVRQDLGTEQLLRGAHSMDGSSTSTRMTPGLNLFGQGGSQSRAGCASKGWSRFSAQGNGSTDIQSAGTTTEAIALLQNRLQRCIATNSYTYVKVLQMCSKQKDLLAAKQVHDCIIQSGIDTNLSVAVTLLNVYINCGALLDARRVFDQLKKKNVVTWTNMIAAYAKSDHAELALELFNRMRQEGSKPNEITYLSILSACASPSALKWGKQIHDCVRHSGFESDVRVGTALIKMYAKCGCIMDARQVFDGLMNRDFITWTVMIGGLALHGCGHEACRLFSRMRRQGFEPDAITYLSILNASPTAGALELVKEVHSHARKAGLESDLRVGNALVHMYAKSDSIDDARLVFDRMEKRDVVTWTAMIGGLAQHGCENEAYRLFGRMRREGFKPNAITYLSILKACGTAGALEWVKEVHEHARKAGLESDLRVGNALIHTYAENGSIHDARRVFDRMEKRDIVTWNTMIGGLAQHGCGHEPYRLFRRLIREGFEPDAVTYLSILNASASAGSLEWVKEVHGHASKVGLESDLRVRNALVHMYAKSGSIDDARLVFDRMEKHDVVTWNTMIGGLAQHGCGNEALELFRQMNADGVKPDATSFVAALSACCHGGLVDEGRRLFLAMTQDYGIEPDIVHYTCMVDLLARAGHLEEAMLFITDMPVEPSVVTWNALLGACRTFGNVEFGELAVKELLKLEPNNASAYVLLSNIYAAAGKKGEVSMVRGMMQKRGVRKEPGRSWIEVDNKIHEFVVGDRSHPEAKAIYSKLDKLTEELEAEGYIPENRLVLHDINVEDEELGLTAHSEKLAIAYGLMHIPRGEPICVWKNLRVCPDCHTATKLISKVTGRKIIARDANRFHHFKDGVCSCGDYW